jgi:hypothetical protein
VSGAAGPTRPTGMDWEQGHSAALSNIAIFGDTDVFPFALENRVMADRRVQVEELLGTFHRDLQGLINRYPPVVEEALYQVGYAGFRWASQIDPFWNAYYLGQVIALGDKIEERRRPIAENAVFSYRFNWDQATNKMFRDIGWRQYRERCAALARQCALVVQTDISDFYQRVYHHRIENGLKRLREPGDVPKRVIDLLSAFQKNVSYGLPVGGNASRMLAELALADSDHALAVKGVQYCRFVDDYTVFCADQHEAYAALVTLSELLHLEGLTLNKRKTRVVAADDFLTTLRELDAADLDDETRPDEQRLLSISIRFDPYSPTAEEDYARLQEAVESVDLVGILSRELGKTAIDETVVRHALRALRALGKTERFGALRTLLQRENLQRLSPVFAVLMRTVRDIYPELDRDERNALDTQLVEIADQQQHLLRVALNLAFYCEALGAGDVTTTKESILQKVWDGSASSLCRRIVLANMARWKSHYFISRVKTQFATLARWERHVFVAASYELGDEGAHWRRATQQSFSPPEILIRDWAADRVQRGQQIPW